MKFFFHLRDIDGYQKDHDGMELPSETHAIAEAEHAAREMVAELVIHEDRVEGRAFEITDERGAVVGTVAFKDIIRLD